MILLSLILEQRVVVGFRSKKNNNVREKEHDEKNIKKRLYEVTY